MEISEAKAVLFDLDGTLIDSEYFYYSNWAPILSEHFQLDISYDDWLNDFAGHTLVRNVGFLNERYDILTTEEFMWKETRSNYAKSDMTKIKLMPYAEQILEQLKGRNVRIGLVTSSYITTVQTVLGHHNLLDYFEFFVTRELVTQAKPNPEPYLLAIEKLDVPKEDIIAIEDTITGYTSATEAGITCYAVTKHNSQLEKLSRSASVYSSLEELVNRHHVI